MEKNINGIKDVGLYV